MSRYLQYNTLRHWDAMYLWWLSCLFRHHMRRILYNVSSLSQQCTRSNSEYSTQRLVQYSCPCIQSVHATGHYLFNIGSGHSLKSCIINAAWPVLHDCSTVVSPCSQYSFAWIITMRWLKNGSGYSFNVMSHHRCMTSASQLLYHCTELLSPPWMQAKRDWISPVFRKLYCTLR